ncbi:MAG: hypothetical protein B7Z22_09895 [Hyphomonas sp. 32-62-5]|nr:MAG: hypothetical protein B7Z22_09895 [Hyphomonas sp. 32-62-5]
MKTPIRTLGAAVVALAAPALFALPSNAQAAVTRIDTPIAGVSIELASSRYHDDFRGPRYHGRNEWGQTDREVRELRRDAVQACRAAIRAEGRHAGFREIDFDKDHWARQAGPRSFFVTFQEVEFETGRRDIETRVDCNVRNGRVTQVSGIPHNRDYRRGPPPGRRW